MKTKHTKIMTSEELIELIKESTKVEGNEIQIGLFYVRSTSRNLKECEETINRLIKKHRAKTDMKDINYFG